MKTKHIVIIALVLAVIVVAVGYLQHKTASTPAGVNPPIPTPSALSPIVTSTLTQIKSTLYLGGQLRDPGEYTIDGFNLTIPQVFQMSPLGTGDIPAHYRWNDIDLFYQTNILTVSKNSAKLLDNDAVFISDAIVNGQRQRMEGAFTFTYQGRQYFLFDGTGCYNTYCSYEMSLYRLDENNTLTRVKPATSKILLAADKPIDIEGVVTFQDKLVLVFGQGNEHDAVVLGADGNFEVEATGQYNKSVSPANILPQVIEQYLQLPRG